MVVNVRIIGELGVENNINYAPSTVLHQLNPNDV